MKYKEYKKLELTKIEEEVLAFWNQNKIFELSTKRDDRPIFTFYEGPPSTNGAPGIHHVLSRTIKDIFSRYKLLKGFNVLRKSGWDTHGLPIELSAEKKLGIKKENIGQTISIEEYNKVCKAEAMKYIQEWNKLTERIGCWIDLENPYITYENYYIESLWYLLKKLYDKGYLYKGYTIQPYSPAAGSGLSSHELNQPGCYRKVKDISIFAQFKLIKNSDSEFLFKESKDSDIFALAWTTTPWTLPSNTALSVGSKIDYSLLSTKHPYTDKQVNVIIAKDLITKVLNKDAKYDIIATFKGSKLNNIQYEQLLKYEQPKDGTAFKIIPGDFVSTESGTGIVHTAPCFGADDFKVAKQNNIGSLNLVDQQGRFIQSVKDFAGRYVKESYYSPEELEDPEFKSTDLLIALKLKQEGMAFKVEKYEHNYPHCWRTDKPIIYYPLDSWFIKTSAAREKLIELNKEINWKPASIGIGRFHNWLENMVDWNLSRSRFWGTPLPIWRSQDNNYEICIGSIRELSDELQKAIDSGVLNANEIVNNKQYLDQIVSKNFDLHKPYIDNAVLTKNGQKINREKY
ncbi:MAG: class I tRNA ligase family protein [Solitalea-like symbiont of Acarus siro]